MNRRERAYLSDVVLPHWTPPPEHLITRLDKASKTLLTEWVCPHICSDRFNVKLNAAILTLLREKLSKERMAKGRSQELTKLMLSAGAMAVQTKYCRCENCMPDRVFESML